MYTITIEMETSGKSEKPVPTFGREAFYLDEAETTAFPHVDRLDNTTVAFIFEKNYQIWAGTATWQGEGRDSKMVKNKVAIANEDCIYQFHGVAGMSRDKFIIAAVGHPNNGTQQDRVPGDLRAKVATVASDGSLTFSDWTTRWFTDSSNWFSLDNFNSWQALACYYDGFEGNGVVAINMFLTDNRNKVEFGGYVMVENGGASVDYQKIEMRILSEDRFGVFFPDASANGNLIFMMGERTANNELTRIGSNFVIARQLRRTVGFVVVSSRIEGRKLLVLDCSHQFVPFRSLGLLHGRSQGRDPHLLLPQHRIPLRLPCGYHHQPRRKGEVHPVQRSVHVP